MTLSRSYVSTGFLVVRSPLLPVAELMRWSNGLVPGEGVPGEGTSAMDHATCRTGLSARLRVAFARPELREALLFAAPALERRLEPALEGTDGDASLDRVLSAYFTRLTSRETPFGTFAGITLGHVRDVTRLELGPCASYRRHTRPGMGHLVRELSECLQQPGVRARMRYEPNATLHAAFGRLRYSSLDLIGHSAEAEAYPIVDVEPTEHLAAALARASGGATLDEIAAAVLAPDVLHEEALEFASTLVDHGILVPSWLPRVSGPEPFQEAVRAMSEHPELLERAERMRSTCRRLAAIDEAPLGGRLAELRALQRDVSADEQPRELAQLFQADLLKPGEVSIGPGQIAALLRAADLVQRTGIHLSTERIERFRERFERRYETRFVPLLEALDADLGLGFESFQSSARDAWIQDLVSSGTRPPGPPASVFGAADQIRLEILSHCLAFGLSSHELDERWLERFPEPPQAELPESFAIAARFAGPVGAMRVIAPSLIAPSAAPLFARFCHADAQLERALRDHVELEQACSPDRVLADVVHLPNAHVANVLLRPVLRSFEIVCGGGSGAPAERQIPLSDLYVGVQGAQVVLFSRRLGKQVAVRITNAHNADAIRNLPVYRFLGALQDAERGGMAIAWSWGCLRDSPFLPRICSKDIVLSRACWRLDELEIAELGTGTSARVFERVRALRQRRRLPRLVSLRLPTGSLVVDLDNCLSVEMFVHEIRGAAAASLEELLPGPDELVLHGPEGSYASELVVPFVRRAPSRQRGVARAVAGTHPAPVEHPVLERSFSPGSEWLYAKIYTGPSQFDMLLERLGETVLGRCQSAGVSCWFFVPYADPAPHLRLRLRGPPHALWGSVLGWLRDALGPLEKAGVVARLQLDTYEREVERYGGPRGIESAEQIFGVDSEACRQLIAECQGDTELRWQLTLVGIDRLLSDLGFDLEERFTLASTRLERYRAEFDVTLQQKKRIANEYRRHSRRLSALLWLPPGEVAVREARALAVIEQRSASGAGACRRLREASDAGGLTRDRASIAGALAHMHAVRMLGPSVRLYELVMYEYLRRQYETRRALAGVRVRGPSASYAPEAGSRCT
jgi:thiopeptide-type bacteriocin biosynthesis protein